MPPPASFSSTIWAAPLFRKVSAPSFAPKNVLKLWRNLERSLKHRAESRGSSIEKAVASSIEFELLKNVNTVAAGETNTGRR